MTTQERVRLTTMANCAGCAAKMGADALANALRPLAQTFGATPDLLVGLGAADDAAVYRLNDEQAIVATVDFFPPVVDDPYTFGAIAATNALSDLYAMGATPLLCLNLVTFPESLDQAILTEIMRGGAEKVREAGAVIAGGHSVIDDEPKYGLAAIGVVHPARVRTKGGARPGDVLLLTKPLGTGVITTALKHEVASEAHVAAAVASMTTLNAAAARALGSLGDDLHACTDVTGFSLLGHAWEMASQSSVAFHFSVSRLPLLPGAREYAAASETPGGTDRNRRSVGEHVTWAEDVSDVDRLLLLDPQTSGGLLAAVAGEAAEQAIQALGATGVSATLIGEVIDGAGLVVER
ncbi:MAG TPA: selenide, water dikinase SelD [Ktedonobacterales bacterium]